MAGWTRDGLDYQITIGAEITFEHHVHVFSNSFRSSVPASHHINQRKGDCVDCCRNTNAALLWMGLEAGQASSTPHQVGHTHQRRNPVSVAIKDDRRHVQGHVEYLSPSFVDKVPSLDDVEVRAEEMGVTYDKRLTRLYKKPIQRWQPTVHDSEQDILPKRITGVFCGHLSRSPAYVTALARHFAIEAAGMCCELHISEVFFEMRNECRRNGGAFWIHFFHGEEDLISVRRNVPALVWQHLTGMGYSHHNAWVPIDGSRVS